MPVVFTRRCTCILFLWFSLIAKTRSSTEQCRDLEFTATRTFKGKRLTNHVIRTNDVSDKQFCAALCFIEENCFSYNIMTSGEGVKQNCELNNATHEGHENDLKADMDYVYSAAENGCASNHCSNKATCQTGFTQKGYRCLCPAGFTGLDCNNDVDECSAGTHSCDPNADCVNNEGSYECTCKPGYFGDGLSCEDIDECAEGKHDCTGDILCHNTKGSFNCTLLSTAKAIYEMNLSRENKAYLLRVGSEQILVYCVLNETGLGSCGGGGWTLVMKIDGTKATFHYNSALWTNQATHNLAGGETGFDTQETKLPTYWNTSFSKICLGMKIPGEETVQFIAVNQSADSLYSLIADPQYHPTSLGRNTWKSLLGSQSSLQPNCNKEGFNVIGGNHHMAKARIGIIGNNENECNTCDSRIGLGTGGYFDDTNTCGVETKYGGDNGDKNIKAMGYIFIQ